VIFSASLALLAAIQQWRALGEVLGGPLFASAFVLLAVMVCCETLTSLVLAGPTRPELARWEDRAGSLDAAVDDPELGWAEDLAAIRAGRHAENAVNVLHCEVCGALFGVYSHT